MAEYRWNQSELAAGYNVGATLVHPHYVEMQDAILAEMAGAGATDGLVVDLGGGSGRLIERVLDRWPDTTALIVDQSQAFLDLAASRLERFGERTSFVFRRLQEDWRGVVTQPAAAIVSMSAIHHLDPDEKQQCYQRCFDSLRPGGVLLNGDEVRAELDDVYREQVECWAEHMQTLIESEAVTPAMAEALRGWRKQNVEEFGGSRVSGDDCHETSDSQLGYFAQAGFEQTSVPWRRELWALLKGVRVGSVDSSC
ncbi:MAG: class I SAM-dependent methyltransferase [Planctomycetaceae bacterium]|nr:class I SAM-dependent methyltransferase [Planctomycetaceae bacterium]